MDYKDTINLPKTSFKMKANLSAKEPSFVDAVCKNNIPEQGNVFFLHDGPPYANGDIHVGHALNKILKDVINRYHSTIGRPSYFIAGWDCHGLPIEWKVEEQFKAKNKDKQDVPASAFRKACRDYANKWIKKQKQDFKRLGIKADWDNSYVTMDYKAEAKILAALYDCYAKGVITRKYKPVLWSVVEETALAEAEVEYKDKESTAIYFGFPIASAVKGQKTSKTQKIPDQDLLGASLAIWTTTPWTIPMNAAVAYNQALSYSLVELDNGQKIIIATSLIADFYEKTNLNGKIIKQDVDLQGVEYSHPMFPNAENRRVFAADFVSDEQGTGLVHNAPAHGLDDFALQQQFGFVYDNFVMSNGVYNDLAPNIVKGKHIFKVNDEIVAFLGDQCYYSYKLTHSYPCSWRSKAPLIYRATQQWFIDMALPPHNQQQSLRKSALQQLDDVEFFPQTGANRITKMVADRPDWCLSRQRIWGVPIAFFKDKQTDEILDDATIRDKVLAEFTKHGSDVWFDDGKDVAYYLADTAYEPANYEKIYDVLDVWFDSGVSNYFIKEYLPPSLDVQTPYDLYVEGSDQHRGWFQSSLLASVIINGHAPYQRLLTHGFVLDEMGRKMSKSLGNIVAPQDVINKYGADILRLWVVTSDYHGDLRIGEAILQQNSDIYRRFRNTIRYILGALHNYEPSSDLKLVDDLELYILAKLHLLEEKYQNCQASYNYTDFYHSLHDFCSRTLSGFYFDVRKDSLYCDAVDSDRRQQTCHLLHITITLLLKWLSPVLVFTVQDIRDNYWHMADATLPDMADPASVVNKWQNILRFRADVMLRLEQKRAEKLIGSSLEACVTIGRDVDVPAYDDWATLCIVSDFIRSEHSDDIKVEVASGYKCDRCWKVTNKQGLCQRCEDAISG